MLRIPIAAIVAATLVVPRGSAGEEAMARGRSVSVFISPGGDDSGPGTRSEPLATLEAARARLRASKGPRTAWLRGGVYPVARTFELSAEDSGAEGARVVYRAYRGEEVRLFAGRRVAAAEFASVGDPDVLRRLDPAARGKVVGLDLVALGIEHAKRWPDRFTDGGGLVELYYDGRRMPLARWPHEGYATIKTVLDSGVWSGANRRGGTFVCRDDRPSRWLAAVEDGLWLDGFWRVPWQPETVRVASIDAAKRTITHAVEVGGGLGSKYSKEVNGTRAGSGKENWYALNLLEEIDRPGEWCVNFRTRRLYFWPPGPLGDESVMIADMAQPVVSIKGASHVMLRGLVIEGGLGDGVVIEGGTGNVIAGCTLRNLGRTGVVIKSGAENGVRSCELHDLGHGGVYIGGGDRKTLTPAGNYAVNNRIHHVGRVKKTYAPAVNLGSYGLDAVGCRVARNLIHDLPHAAVLYGGNDNVLELNEIHRVALDSGDVGAFYSWHDWTSRGNVVRHNFVHDSPGANGVYLDDGDSGDAVIGNVFVRAACGPFVGGGHDNIVRGNVSVECAKGIHIDSRGVPRGYNAGHARLVGGLEAVDYMKPPWSERYPEMTKILEFHPDWPTGTVIEGNVTVRCGKPLVVSGQKEHFEFTRIDGNLDVPEGDAGFADERGGDFSLRPDSRIPRELPGFEAIPSGEIGLKPDVFTRRLRSSGASAEAGPVRRGEVFDSETDMRKSNEDAGAR